MLESLHCNSCGAPIQVPCNARYVRCNHCEANLQVRSEAGVTFTEVLQQLTQTTNKLSETTAQLSSQVNELAQNSKLEELNREWNREKEHFLVHAKRGSHLPISGLPIGACIAGVFGVFWTIKAISITSMSAQVSHSPGIFKIFGYVFPLLGVLFEIVAITSGFNQISRYQEYERARKEYERKRHKILSD